MSWMDAAACRGAPLAWFVDDDAGTRAERWVPRPEALERCGHCQVTADCLDEALADGLVGCWGGTSTAQRRQLARPRVRLACPVCRDPGGVVRDGPDQVCLACAVSWRAA